ncbi:MAG: helix-turn-helix domain-containing protein [Chloroflexi bacterium]|nr:helix-turn-helix domain-containing protein [Chloroflexota bacterium]
MSLADRAIASHGKPTRADGLAWILGDLIERGGQFKRCNGKEPFDRDPGATLDQLVEHDGNIAIRPSSLHIICVDFDKGKSRWLTDVLDKLGIPHCIEKSRRGDHVFFPVSKKCGSNFAWENENGSGCVIYSKMVVIKDAAILTALLEKIGPNTPRATRSNVFRHLGKNAAPRPSKAKKDNNEADEVIDRRAKLRKRDDGGYFEGNRNNQLVADTWYDTIKGLTCWGHFQRALEAHLPDKEDLDVYRRQLERSFHSTRRKAEDWKQSCMDAAEAATQHIEGATPKYRRVLGAMWAISKTTSLCWAKQETLALVADCSIKTVYRAQKFWRRHKIIHYRGFHYSNTVQYSFGDVKMSDKPFFFLWAGLSLL